MDTLFTEPLAVPIDAQIAEVEYEIRMRERVYKACIEKNTMTQRLADQKLGAMRAVLQTLYTIKTKGST